jgi:hypothetical protein
MILLSAVRSGRAYQHAIAQHLQLQTTATTLWYARNRNPRNPDYFPAQIIVAHRCCRCKVLLRP